LCYGLFFVREPFAFVLNIREVDDHVQTHTVGRVFFAGLSFDEFGNGRAFAKTARNADAKPSKHVATGITSVKIDSATVADTNDLADDKFVTVFFDTVFHWLVFVVE
jgi:hypothetical protein